jgi:MoxR-like ATPase
MQTRKHIQSLLSHISQGLYEKDHIIALALLCAISGENLFLLGPPGTAKSEVARRLKMVFHDATAFEYLMSRFSTPDEIFGPVSIQKLKQEDTYQRKVDGFLPAATIVFLDEIWKAGPAIQNALLTVINEKIYQNGSSTIHVPMKCLIAASNELPAEDEGLEALWDRFIMRVVSNCISDERTFYKMLTMAEMPQITIPDELKITDQLFLSWQQQIKTIAVPKHILKAITAIRKQLATAAEGEEVEPLDFYISDRRWRKNIQILRTSAFLNGRHDID